MLDIINIIESAFTMIVCLDTEFKISFLRSKVEDHSTLKVYGLIVTKAIFPSNGTKSEFG